MSRSLVVPILVALAMLFPAGPARAQDAPAGTAGEIAPPAGEPAGAEAPAPAAADAAVGERVEIRMKGGVVLTGMVKSRQFEVQRGFQFQNAENEDTPGAGLRVWYAMGLNGFIFVPHEEVEGIRFLGGMTEAEVKALVAELEDARIKAEQDRARAAAEMAAKRQAKKAAAEEGNAEGTPPVAPGEEPADTGKGPVPPPAGAPAVPADPARLAKMKELLQRFPPRDWKPTRLEEIKKRIIVLDVFPSTEEQAFIENFDLWMEGYRLWQQAQGGESEGGEAPDADKPPSPPPAPPREKSFPPPTPPGQPLPRESGAEEPAGPEGTEEPAGSEETAAPEETAEPAGPAEGGGEDGAGAPAEGD